MTLKKSGFLKIFAILLLALICSAAATVWKTPANAATSSEKTDPYAPADGAEALITYERYQTGIIGFQYALTLCEERKNPELLKRAADMLNEDYAETDWTAEAAADGKALYLSVSFDTVTDYYIAAGITGFDPPEEDDGEGVTTETTAFYVYTTTEMQTVFAEKSETSIVSFLETVAGACGVPEEKVSYRYFYATKYKKAITTNADSVLEYDDCKLHIFDISRDDFGRKITITSCNPNPDSWYYLAVGTGVLVAIATGTVIAVNYAKKKES